MRRHLFIAIIFFALGLFFLSWLIVANARADPFLVCDPEINVTHYVFTIDGVTEIVPSFDLGDGTFMLKYDLANISEGEHICELKARNEWGDSLPIPFVFIKQLPVAPGHLRIE